MKKTIWPAVIVTIFIMLLCAPLISKNSAAPAKEDKITAQKQKEIINPTPTAEKTQSAMAFPTPYNSALQDLKFEFSVSMKSDAVTLMIYTADKVLIKRIELGALAAGSYIRVFDRTEFAGIESGTYYYNIIYNHDGRPETTDYRVMYILR